MMQKIALVHRHSPSSWVSCRSITSNLVAAYRLAFANSEIREFSLRCGMSRQEVFAQATRLAEFNPGSISFIDHAPHPGDMLRALISHYAASANRSHKPFPQLNFHVFGDFALNAASWLDLKNLLSRQAVRFVCASEKQASLVRRFLREGNDDLAPWIPFPVSGDEFSFSAADIDSARDKFGLRKNDWAFVYTGRLSMQKNVTLLLSVFANFLEKVDANAHLFLAGPPDDLGVPYLGFHPLAGWFSSQLSERMRTYLTPAQRNQVHYLGELNPAEQRLLHHASDCYVSLSTHNDEDFGMAPAEAALCGSPLLLTDWGGFSSFRHLGASNCRLIPVKMRERAVLPEAGAVLSSMTQSYLTRVSIEQRDKLARAAFEFCSIESVAKKLSATLNSSPSPFAGFSAIFSDLARAFRGNPGAPFLSGEGYSKTYRVIYEPYL
jgi:glycosyltransferase involved in cell wall biosynthesis